MARPEGKILTRYQLTKNENGSTIYGVLELKVNQANNYRAQGYTVEQVPKNYDVVKLHRQGKPNYNLLPSKHGESRTTRYARPEVRNNMATIRRDIIRRPQFRRVHY